MNRLFGKSKVHSPRRREELWKIVLKMFNRVYKYNLWQKASC